MSISSFSSSIYSSSFSAAKSQTVNLLSADYTDKLQSEFGANEIDVIGSVWKSYSFVGFLGYLFK